MSQTLAALCCSWALAILGQQPHPFDPPNRPWIVEECPEGTRSLAEKAAERIRGAERGTARYLPAPFPTSRDEILRDWVYAYDTIWGRSGDPAHTRLAHLVTSGRARYEIHRVVNWSRNRCPHWMSTSFSRGIEVPHYWLLRIFDPDSSDEIARAALDASGQAARLSLATTEDALRAFPDLTSSTERLTQRVGIGAMEGAQYVKASGSVHCSATLPCVAVRHGQDIYLHESVAAGDRILRATPLLERHSGDILWQRAGLEALLGGLPSGQALVSAGYTVLVFEEIVPESP